MHELFKFLVDGATSTIQSLQYISYGSPEWDFKIKLFIQLKKPHLKVTTKIKERKKGKEEKEERNRPSKSKFLSRGDVEEWGRRI